MKRDEKNKNGRVSSPESVPTLNISGENNMNDGSLKEFLGNRRQ